MNYRIFIIVLLFLFLGTVQAANDQVQVKSDKIWGDTKKKITYMEGNVRIVQGLTVITTAKTKVDMDKNVATFEDKVNLIHPDLTIAADHLDYNFKKKNGTFSENVVLSRTEVKDEHGKVTKDAFKLTAEELYFESDTKNFVAKSQGAVTHKEFSGTADIIEYDDGQQELLFKGNAMIKRPNGEVIKGDEIVINTQNNSLIVKSEVNLSHDDVTITAGHLEYDYKKKQGDFSDNVVLNRAETKDSKGRTKDQFKLTTEGLHFESDTKNFVTKGKGNVEHKDFTGSADQIEYNDGHQSLIFKSNAKLTRPKGEEINGDTITIHINDRSFVVTKQVAINFKVESDEESQTKNNKKGKN